jgi:hypothetical protein
MTTEDDEMFAGLIAAAMASAPPNAPEVTVRSSRCPCGSGQHGYNLRDHTGKLLLYCCFSCEQPRRALLKEDGGILTKPG